MDILTSAGKIYPKIILYSFCPITISFSFLKTHFSCGFIIGARTVWRIWGFVFLKHPKCWSRHLLLCFGLGYWCFSVNSHGTLVCLKQFMEDRAGSLCEAEKLEICSSKMHAIKSCKCISSFLYLPLFWEEEWQKAGRRKYTRIFHWFTPQMPKMGWSQAKAKAINQAFDPCLPQEPDCSSLYYCLQDLC